MRARLTTIDPDELSRVAGGYLPVALAMAANAANSPWGQLAMNQLGFIGTGLLDKGLRRPLEDVGILPSPHVDPPIDPSLPTVPISR